MAVYLLAWGERPGSGRRAELLGRLAAEGFEVVRTWPTPAGLPDLFVARRPEWFLSQGGVDWAAGVGVRASEVRLERDSEAEDPELLASLPQTPPDSLRSGDVLAFIGRPLVWCDRCRDFHPPGRHTRSR